jgi:GTPase SAR1 family protein
MNRLAHPFPPFRLSTTVDNLTDFSVFVALSSCQFAIDRISYPSLRSRRDSQTEKTPIIVAIIGQPLKTCAPTVGAIVTQNPSIESSCDPNLTVPFHVWDTAGQERYRSLGPMYYKCAYAASAASNLTNVESFSDVSESTIVCLYTTAKVT